MLYKFNDNLRILILKDEVLNLPVSPEYCFKLLESIDKYRDQILERSLFDSAEKWDDLEAIQQVTLSDAIEAKLIEILDENEKNP